MAAAAHLRGHVVFNSASNARRHTQAPAPSLSRGRLPTARKPPVARCQRHGVGALELDDGAARRPAPRFLCLHGFRTSGEIMRRQVADRWPAGVTSRLDLAFPDAPFPAEGDSPVRGVFDPPYYEWCRFAGEDFLKYKNFGECLAGIEELMVRQGPFDGLFGFSQGALLSAALVGLQQQGLALNRVPRVKYVMIISGAKIQSPALAAKAYANKINCASLHFIGDGDFVKAHGEELADSFVDPLVIRHPAGHTVPRLGKRAWPVDLEESIWVHGRTGPERSERARGGY
ncbi:esterase C25G4.2-like isoform X1 [Triticum dicoccoides]|uniref:esterase C25G4.2-like isoform X1 n=1 Tax=Triticum dicoccoides TaxID=85692 RepID=UPI00188F18BB|nr:esterase C25G4.2-like isoform X1 [Triticum dicoccoides]